MKKTIIAVAMAAASLTAINAHAINDTYRRALIKSGCSEVDIANGACVQNGNHIHRVHKSKPYQEPSQASGECTQAAEAQGECVMESRHNGGTYGTPNVINKFQGEAVDMMDAAGWTRVSEDGLKWKKGSTRVTLMLSASQQVKDVIYK